MPKKKEFQQIADTLATRLKSEGFVIQRYNAYSTVSVYLKLDYGLVYSLRISDHAGKKHLKYTYNLIKGYSGKRLVKEGTVWRQYYSFSQIDELVAAILAKREWVKERYYPDYAKSMEDSRLKNEGKRGFWAEAVLV